MAWVDLEEALFISGKAGKGSIFKQFRDNMAALYEGAVGAPKIQGAAFDSNVITQAKMADNSVGKAEIIANSIGSSELTTSLSGGDNSLSLTANASYTFPAGHYMWIAETSTVLQLYVNGAWEEMYSGGSAGGFIVSDGSNVRAHNDTGVSVSPAFYYKKLSL